MKIFLMIIPFFGVLLVLVQIRGHIIYLPQRPDFGILNGRRSLPTLYPLNHVLQQQNDFRSTSTGYDDFASGFMLPNYDRSIDDSGMIREGPGFYQSGQGVISPDNGLPLQVVRDRWLNYRQPFFEHGYRVQQGPQGGLPLEQVNTNRVQTRDQLFNTAGQLYNTNLPQREGNTRENSLYQSSVSGNRSDKPRTTGKSRVIKQASRRPRPGGDREGRDRNDRRGGIREGYIGALGGVNGYPFMGGFCGGSPECSDGGLSAGVANGIGIGSLEEFNKRRQNGRNENLSLYEALLRQRTKRRQERQENNNNSNQQ